MSGFPENLNPSVPLNEDEKKKRLWAMIVHLAALTALFGIPFANVLGPLLVWQLKKNDIPSIDAHGKEAVNFQLSMLIYLSVSVALCFIFIGFISIFLLVVTDVILSIIAGIKANDGAFYKYPLTIRFLK